MLEKVGLMEKGNLESTPMAYVRLPKNSPPVSPADHIRPTMRLTQRTYRLWNPKIPLTVTAAASFKKRFSRDVIIDFVGVWGASHSSLRVCAHLIMY